MKDLENKNSLNERFKQFLNTLSGIEDIDTLTKSNQATELSKADYFAKNRQLVIELKSLETDTEYKAEGIIKKHRTRPEFPHFFGRWEVEKVLKHLPDKDEINKQIVKAVVGSLTNIYRKANSQIRTTKSTFNISDSQGLLIVLNENINVLTPELIIYELVRMASKTNPDKSYQFTEINSILLISEAHFSPSPNNEMGFIILHKLIEPIVPFAHNDFIDFLTTKWSEYNKIPLYDKGEINSMKNLNLQSVLKYKKETKKEITRQESWERYYKFNPYFRKYDEKMMLWMYEMIMTELAPGMLKGATQQEKNKVKFWIEVFTHFMEEIDYRGMDLKFFAPKSREIGKQIEKEMKKKFSNSED